LSNNENLWKSLAAVIGATILSVIGPKVISTEQLTWSKWSISFFIAVLLLLYSFNFIERFWLKLVIFIRKNRNFCPKIGIIYSVSNIEPSNIPLVWTDVAPECWGSLVRNAAETANKKIIVKLIDAKSSFDSFNVIINPYGGNLPELNLVTFPVYNKLLDYIKKGGFFVNIADIPTYWSFNPLINRLVDRTPAVYDIHGAVSRHFQRTPLLEELALSAYNLGEQNKNKFKLVGRYSGYGEKEISLRLSRCVKLESHIESVTLPIKLQPNLEVSPLFFCNYGDGLCLISMSWLDREKCDKNYPDKKCIDYGADNNDLKKIIPYLIVQKLFEKYNKANAADAKCRAAD